MSRILENDFDRMYDVYGALIYKIAVVYLKNRADAEDVVQNVFVKLFCKAPDFLSAAEEKAWIIKVTVNCCKNEKKSFWKRKVDLTDDKLDDIPDFTDEDRAVMDEVFSLPPNYRTVIYLYYIEGYKIDEISKILSLSRSAVKMRLSRGREMLKTGLKEVL